MHLYKILSTRRYLALTAIVKYISVPMLAFLGLSVLDLGPMYATYVRCQTASSLNAHWAGHINH